MPKPDYSNLIVRTLTLRKELGNPFKAQVKNVSDNDQYVQLELENGSKVWECVDYLTIEGNLEISKETEV